MEIHTLDPLSLDSKARTHFNLTLPEISQRFFFFNQQTSGSGNVANMAHGLGYGMGYSVTALESK